MVNGTNHSRQTKTWSEFHIDQKFHSLSKLTYVCTASLGKVKLGYRRITIQLGVGRDLWFSDPWSEEHLCLFLSGGSSLPVTNVGTRQPFGLGCYDDSARLTVIIIIRCWICSHKRRVRWYSDSCTVLVNRNLNQLMVIPVLPEKRICIHFFFL